MKTSSKQEKRATGNPTKIILPSLSWLFWNDPHRWSRNCKTNELNFPDLHRKKLLIHSYITPMVALAAFGKLKIRNFHQHRSVRLNLGKPPNLHEFHKWFPKYFSKMKKNYHWNHLWQSVSWTYIWPEELHLTSMSIRCTRSNLFFNVWLMNGNFSKRCRQQYVLGSKSRTHITFSIIASRSASPLGVLSPDLNNDSSQGSALIRSMTNPLKSDAKLLKWMKKKRKYVISVGHV